MNPKSLEPEDLKEGETYVATFIGQWHDDLLRCITGTAFSLGWLKCAYELTALLPEDGRLMVGEEVRWPRVSSSLWKVIAVVGGEAWIRLDIPYNSVAPISQLVRPDGTPIPHATWSGHLSRAEAGNG